MLIDTSSKENKLSGAFKSVGVNRPLNFEGRLSSSVSVRLGPNLTAVEDVTLLILVTKSKEGSGVRSTTGDSSVSERILHNKGEGNFLAVSQSTGFRSILRSVRLEQELHIQ